jgi:hypothetical protein
VDSYLQQRFVALGTQALTRTRIYLDTNFWADLRDYIAGIRTMPSGDALLATLRDAVTERRAVCTYSSHTLEELMKHAVPATREATARIVDELSDGFCLANPERMLANEIVHWIASAIFKLPNLCSLTEIAWTRPFFIVVDYSPPRPEDASGQAVYQGFVDRVWNQTLAQVL